ncbi:MAG: hypothetical protein HPY57_04300 [Ignavibacteria bacterium]|nr:hypothetical protein [Ignavibacteria bacterium]
MNELLHILKYKIISFLNINRFSSRSAKIRGIISSLIFIGFGYGTFLFTKSILSYLLEEVHIGLFLLHRFVSMLLFVFFFSINAGNIVVAYSMIFKSNEVYHLMTKPVHYIKIFVFKMFESILYSSPTFLLLGSAVLFGYGSYFQLGIEFYFISIFLIFLPFVFTAAILGIILLLILIQLAKKIGLKSTIAIVLIVYLASVYGFFKVTNPRRLVNEVMRYYPNLNFDFSFLDPFFSIYLPNHWFAESLHWFVKGNNSLALQYVLMIFLVFALVVILAILTGLNLYHRSYLTSLELKAQRSLERSRDIKNSGFFSFSKNSFYDAQTEVLLKKEFWQFFREPAQWFHLSVILFLILIFIASISKVNLFQALPFLQTVTYLIVFIFNSFLISSISLRFLYPIVSIEAEALWKIKSAPISIKKLLLVKFLPITFLTVIIAELLNFFSHIPIKKFDMLLITSSINIFFVAISLSALNFGMGMYFLSFGEKNPVKVASSQGATISFLINLVYLVFLIATLIYPVNDYFFNSTQNLNLKYTPFIISSTLILIVSLILIYFSQKVSQKKLCNDY